MWEQDATVERIEVSVPAELRQVRVLRLVVAGTLSIHDFGVDVVDDVRSAVDESCALVLGDRGAPGRLNLTLQCAPTGVSAVVQGTFVSPPDRAREEDLLPERMLKPFVDSYEVDLTCHRVTFDRRI